VEGRGENIEHRTSNIELPIVTFAASGSADLPGHSSATTGVSSAGALTQKIRNGPCVLCAKKIHVHPPVLRSPATRDGRWKHRSFPASVTWVFEVRCSVFNVQCPSRGEALRGSKFDVRSSMFEVRCSMPAAWRSFTRFDVRSSMFSVQCVCCGSAPFRLGVLAPPARVSTELR